MAPNLIVATACATAALVPVLGPYTPLFAVAAGGLAATQRLPIRFDKLKGFAMVRSKPPTERRIAGRRDEDKMPMARIKALEENTAKDRRELKRHVKICEMSGKKNEADNAKIIHTQAEQGAVLMELQEILPWMKDQYVSSKWWKDVGHSVANFFWGMAKKNWDSVSGKLIFVAAGAAMAYKGVPWSEVLKWISG